MAVCEKESKQKIDRYDEQCHKIESRSREDICALLEGAGIQRNSQDWQDYERAKTLILWHSGIIAQTYEKQLEWIVDYLCL